MTITLDNVGRRFNQEWIFRKVDQKFSPGEKYAILGPNGSGKSTLLSVILGNLSASEGKIEYRSAEIIPVENIYQQLSFAAPYLDLIEEFTLQETIDFHFKFKSLQPGLDKSAVLALLGLTRSQDKALKYFSSGMKQRTKLALACCTDTPLLLLDEPTSNLDKQGVGWYHELIEKFTANRLVIVCSNQEIEYSFCNHLIHVTDYK
ncbi:ABC transporter ATP-binding protein [Pedobacter metabolipauper]|uniref:ABC-type multidrug transport system ATPase subunit n=1 Tax=Pedobacter metabolipauper TaxID=425513 RepID=A0A4V3D176_9SPHI|nr:ATP-binding cassette domain-containing protein [Pedobacter metabolipauper]TDQ09587.1 ABC-type multidrug transport system ATPase subunit [Pedobacter metabolipauper]